MDGARAHNGISLTSHDPINVDHGREDASITATELIAKAAQVTLQLGTILFLKLQSTIVWRRMLLYILAHGSQRRQKSISFQMLCRCDRR
jgi:hypothetical protein